MGNRFSRVTCLAVLALAVAATLPGCGTDLFYVPALALGQLDAIARSVPIEEVLADNDFTPEEVAKLELIVDARRYAIDEVGLTAGVSFTTFLDTGDSSKSYNISASHKDRFRAVTWTFPVVGSFPYLIYFDRAAADRKYDQLVADDFDVLMYEVDAYSTTNLIPNPVRSVMLRRDDLAILDTVMHEMLHDTIWRANDTTFNESLATYVGRAGTVAYLGDRFAELPELVDEAVARYQDIDRYNAFIFDLYNELEGYYASDLAREEKIAGRAEVYAAARGRFVDEIQPQMSHPENYDWVANLPTNNAWMLSNYRYNLDLDLFAQVSDAAGGDWAATLEVFRDAARSDDPKAFMRAWLTSEGDR